MVIDGCRATESDGGEEGGLNYQRASSVPVLRDGGKVS